MKVFVSSTSRDLTDFRAAAIRSLRRLGHEVVAMEEFTAATSFPLNRVLKLVREADAYVLIVAWRYGFTPDCSNVPDLPATGEDSFPKSILGSTARHGAWSARRQGPSAMTTTRPQAPRYDDVIDLERYPIHDPSPPYRPQRTHYRLNAGFTDGRQRRSPWSSAPARGCPR